MALFSTSIDKNNLKIYLWISGLIYILFLLAFFIEHEAFSVTHYILFIAVLSIFSWGSVDLKNRGINAYNLFIITYFGIMLLSLLLLSNLQEAKSLYDIYYILFGPLITLAFLYFSERINVKKVKIRFLKVSPNTIALSLLVTLILLKSYIFYTKGIRLISFMHGDFPGGDAFVVPGITGLSNIAFWLLIMMIPFVRFRMKIFIITITIAISILIVKRGDIMREILFLSLLFVYLKKDLLFNKKNLVILFIGALVTINIFSYFGEKRQHSHDADFSIVAMLDSKIDSISFSWIYAYTAINFEVLNTYIYDDSDKIMYPFDILKPAMNLMGMKKEIAIYEGSNWFNRIEGFNAVPYQATFIKDMGMLYIIETIIYSLMLALFILLSRILKAEGVYIFVLTLIAFSFFGAYLLNPQFFYVAIAGLLLNIMILKEGRNSV